MRKYSIPVILCLLLGCSEDQGKADRDASNNDVGGIAVEPGAVSIEVLSFRTESLSGGGPPRVLATVAVANGLQGGVVVSSQTFRVQMEGNAVEEKSALTSSSIRLDLKDHCVDEGVFVAPNSVYTCTAHFEVAYDSGTLVDKVVLVTSSEDPDQPSVRSVDDSVDFSKCDECDGTCMPTLPTNCGSCGTTCQPSSALGGGDQGRAFCLGGSEEVFRVDGERRDLTLAHTCITWLDIGLNESKTCSMRCAEDGYVCVSGQGYNNGIEVVIGYGPLEQTSGQATRVDCDHNSSQGQSSIPDFERLICSCFPAPASS